MPALEYFMGTTSTSALFKGTSTYSTDFANVISRAVAIASLPVQQLTNDKTTLTSQSDELTKLDTTFTALQTAVQKIGSALGGSAFQTSVSTDNVVDVSVADGAREGNYSMNVTNIGAYESSMSTQNWSVAQDAPGKATTFTLVVGNRNYSITPADNSAKSVADAINASYGNLVQATTVNVSPGDTRISLKSVGLGQTSLDILKIPASPTPTSLQQQAAAGYAISQSTASWDSSGSPATYTLVIGGTQHDIAMTTGNSAAEVVSAINAAYGGQVRASVVDLGTSTSPDLRISLQSTTAGPMSGFMTLDLKKAAGASLQTQQIAATNRTTSAWNATADPAGTRGTYNLVVGATKLAFTPADNSAASVAAAINGLYGDQVHASVVDLETGGHPDYRISLQSKTGSSTTFDIQKTTVANFQNEQTAGVLASYEINNSGVVNSSATRNITISDGVTATLLGTSPSSGATPVDITVTRSTSALNTALSGFADAYNAAADELISQRGQSAGALGGQSIISQLSGILSSISTYSANGQFNVLEDLGLKLETNGHFTYNAFAMMSADLTSSTSVTSFLGSATGSGFLKQATDALTSVEDSATGLLKITETDMKAQIAKLGTTITDKQSKVDALQISLQNRMAVADAMIASMQQQYTYLSSLFGAQQTADQTYK
jgi:flagellar hook-associated protein 2